MMKRAAMRIVLLLAGISIMTLTDAATAQSPLPLRPYCLDRFEIGLPEHTEVSEKDNLGWLAYDAAFGGSSVFSTAPRAASRRDLFEKAVIERIGRIKPPPGETSSLKSTRRIDSRTTEFVYRPDDQAHAHVLFGQFVPGMLDIEILFERAERLFRLRGSGEEDARAKTSADLLALAARVRARDDAEIPTEPGFCIPGGFISGMPATGHERISIDFNVPSHPELVIELSTLVLADVSGLTPKQRAERTQGMLSRIGARVKRVRFADRTLAGVIGFENAQIFGGPGEREILFTWRSNPEADSLARPSILISLQTRADTVLRSMSEPQVIAFWDALTRSFRMRPNALGADPAPSPPR